MIRIVLISFLTLIVCAGNAQKSHRYKWPLDSPFVITGNYGELRPNHFHAGIDFSTYNRLNLPIYAIQDGYVSRIKVGAGGYGKCIYVTHADGRVSVYAHLNAYAIKTATLVKAEQYKLQQYEIEIFPKQNAITVKKGEIIGLSGNTGNSTGPHLHFEIRDEKTETPLNVLEIMPVNDKTPPTLQSIAIYDLSDTCAPLFIRTIKVNAAGQQHSLTGGDVVLEENILGIAFAGFDRIYPAGNINNVNQATLYFDDKVIHQHQLSTIDFADNRFVNEFSEAVQRTKYQRCFLPALYPQRFATASVQRGRIFLKDTSFHKIRLVLKDEKGNTTELKFRIRARRVDHYRPPRFNGDVFVNCNKDELVRNNNLRLTIPKATLYQSTPLLLTNDLEKNSSLSIFPEVNLRSAALLSLSAPTAREKNNKAVLVSGKTTYVPEQRNDSLLFSIKTFGKFKLVYDEQPPFLSVYKPKQGKTPQVPTSVSFKIADQLSGIGSYHLYLNNEWVLAEYDAKFELLTYYFDENTPKGNLNFHLKVSDRVGNKSEIRHEVRR